MDLVGCYRTVPVWISQLHRRHICCASWHHVVIDTFRFLHETGVGFKPMKLRTDRPPPGSRAFRAILSLNVRTYWMGNGVA